MLDRGRLAQAFDDGGVGHAAALTHRLQPIPTATLLQCIHECGHDTGTAGAERVADSDSAAIHVRPREDVRLLPVYILCPGQYDGVSLATVYRVLADQNGD